VQVRTLVAGEDGRVRTDTPSDTSSDTPSDRASDTSSDTAVRWTWVDVVATPDDLPELIELAQRHDLDRLAVRDTVIDVDVPKVDDFGSHLLVVLHGLREDRVATYEVDCFVADRLLVTVRRTASPAVEALRALVQERPDVARTTADELCAVLADLLTRRLLSVLEAFDDRVEELVAKALRADGRLLEDLTAVRTDLVAVRRVVHPQREALDVLRHSTSRLVTEPGRRRFSDVFDVASRAAAGLDEARAALAETLDAYRGAEARQATEVTKVLTVYAAIMLPLSLIAGIFGMNFVNLPWLERDWGWVAAVSTMAVIALVSLGVFVSLGWIRRPTGRRAGQTLGRGLLEATRTPVHLVGAVVEMSTMPLRATTRLVRVAPRSRDVGHDDDRDDPGPDDAGRDDPGRGDAGDDEPDEDAPHHGSE
jgi:magnesium transporter